MDELTVIEARASAADEGPWEYSGQHGYFDVGSKGTGKPIFGADARDNENTIHNVEFIANARTDVPELIAEVRRLRQANAALRDVLEHASETGSLQLLAAHAPTAGTGLTSFCWDCGTIGGNCDEDGCCPGCGHDMLVVRIAAVEDAEVKS